MWTATRENARRQELVDRICRAVECGDSARLDILLAVLDAVADTAMLDQLTHQLEKFSATGPLSAPSAALNCAESAAPVGHGDAHGRPSPSPAANSRVKIS